MVKRVVHEICDWSKQILFVLLATLFISIFVLQPFEVSGQSMQPTFDSAGERVVVFKTPFFLNHMPDYGDIVVVDSRVNESRTLKDEVLENSIVGSILGTPNTHIWIKRVIGLPNDKLEFIEGNIYRNGELLNEQYIKEDMAFPFETIVVPQDHVYVMGDNRNNSKDSRQIGPLPLDNICGKVLMRFFPFKEISIF